MLKEARVAATVGVDFDPVYGQSFIRLSDARSADDVREAVTRIARRLG
jgi:aspartate/methionine/tyrosine aminotransferase